VKNGTIDVMTGEFREHLQEDMITKTANVVYDPGADCPAWKQFIREIMNYKADIIICVQTVAGWALTGDTSVQNDVHALRQRG
jgi:putative DNA primase/helicase